MTIYILNDNNHKSKLKYISLVQTWKNFFFVNSAILGVQIWQKKCVNYNKFELATKHLKSNIEPKCILFLSFDRCYMILPYFLLSIYIFWIVYRLSRWHFKVISYLHFQGSKFGGKIYKFSGKSKKKWTLQSSWSLFIPSLIKGWTDNLQDC